jgi:hypothetical protein
MTTRIFTLIAFISPVLSAAQFAKPDADEMRLNGCVQSIKEYNYIDFSGVPADKLALDSTVLDSILSSEWGTIPGYSFNQMGYLTTCEYFGGGLLQPDQDSFLYDDKGRLFRRESYWRNPTPKELHHWHTYSYDTVKRSCTVLNYRGPENLTDSTTITFDKTMTRMEQTWYYGLGYDRDSVKNRYYLNDEGNCVESYYFCFTDSGRLHGYSDHRKMLYDDRGFLIKETIMKLDTIHSIYDRSILDSASEPPDIYTYAYELDKHKNWTKQISYYNGTTLEVIYRKIKYYPESRTR